MQSTTKRKEKVQVEEVEGNELAVVVEGTENRSGKKSPVLGSTGVSSVADDDDDDAQIKKLQTELLLLQKSKKVDGGLGTWNRAGDVEVGFPEAGFQGMKENIVLADGYEEQMTETYSGMRGRNVLSSEQVKFQCGTEEKMSKDTEALQENKGNKNTADIQEKEMDCGDIIRMVALIEGKQKEIGKGIVMGLPSSKFARKVIPKGWRSIKVTSYTCHAMYKVCLLPTGWSDQVKQQTVREANGRNILWPDCRIRSFISM